MRRAVHAVTRDRTIAVTPDAGGNEDGSMARLIGICVILAFARRRG